MHGVRRERTFSRSELERHYKESARVADVIRRALVLRRTPLQRPLGDEFLRQYNLVDSALLTNPDEYTLWTFRREVLLLTTESASESNVESLWKKELLLTARALHNHPKAYPAWQHRLWLLQDHTLCERLPDKVQENTVSEEEILTRQMLMKDPRNFHTWAHRMRIRAIIASHKPQQSHQLERNELSFVEEKINEDFANFSAWHHRSVLLPHVGETSNDTVQLIRDELHYVRQAFYTDPDVQSVWFYHRWLLAGAPVRGAQATLEPQILTDELDACNELLELEPEAKYVLQTKSHILQLLARHGEAYQCLEKLIQLVRFIQKPIFALALLQALSRSNTNSFAKD